MSFILHYFFRFVFNARIVSVAGFGTQRCTTNLLLSSTGLPRGSGALLLFYFILRRILSNMKSLLLQGFIRLFGSSVDGSSSRLTQSTPKTPIPSLLSSVSTGTPSPSTFSEVESSTHLPESNVTIEENVREPFQSGNDCLDCSKISLLGTASTNGSGSVLSRSTSSRTFETIIQYRASHQSQCDWETVESQNECEPNWEGTITSLFRRFCYGQAVVIGKLPMILPKGHIYVISRDEDVQPYCWHVRCGQDPEEWPTELALMGFDWRESTVWLLRMQNVSDAVLLQQLKAVATMSAPCSVVLLVSWSPIAVEVADEAGFSMGVEQHGKPLYLLRRKVRQARCDNTDDSPLEPAFDGWVVRFDLDADEMPTQDQDLLITGCAKVIGSCKALGEWDFRRGVVLEESGGSLIAEVLIERGGRVEYKYVIEGKEGVVVWECGKNRCLPDMDGISMWLEDCWKS
eukprot:gb/GEZJ01002045.1/.p1 GENE.gb/GEZJ01002045.1/~~gb/GEZJ01002045.1/.p1  ORF type:complete len:459 (-),score=22.18 gb/GEZJ01002045.1/:564-1940(-)